MSSCETVIQYSVSMATGQWIVKPELKWSLRRIKMDSTHSPITIIYLQNIQKFPTTCSQLIVQHVWRKSTSSFLIPYSIRSPTGWCRQAPACMICTEKLQWHILNNFIRNCIVKPVLSCSNLCQRPDRSCQISWKRWSLVQVKLSLSNVCKKISYIVDHLAYETNYSTEKVVS